MLFNALRQGEARRDTSSSAEEEGSKTAAASVGLSSLASGEDQPEWANPQALHRVIKSKQGRMEHEKKLEVNAEKETQA